MRSVPRTLVLVLLVVGASTAGCMEAEGPEDAGAADHGPTSDDAADHGATAPPPTPVPWRFDGEAAGSMLEVDGTFEPEAFCNRTGCAGAAAAGTGGPGSAVLKAWRQTRDLTVFAPEGVPVRVKAVLTWDPAQNTSLRAALVTEGAIRLVNHAYDADDGTASLDATMVREGPDATLRVAVDAWRTDSTTPVGYALTLDVDADPEAVPAGSAVRVSLPAAPDTGIFMASKERFRNTEVTVLRPDGTVVDTVGTVGGARTWVPPADMTRGDLVLVVPAGGPPMMFEPFGFEAPDTVYDRAGPEMRVESVETLGPDGAASLDVDLGAGDLGLFVTAAAQNATSIVSWNYTITAPTGATIMRVSGCGGCLVPGGTVWRLYAGVDEDTHPTGTYTVAAANEGGAGVEVTARVLGLVV